MKPKTTTKTRLRIGYQLILPLIFAVVIFASCGQQEKEKRQKDLDDFRTWVQQHRDSLDVYVTHNWDELNNEYEQKKAVFEKDMDKMDDKARETYNGAVNDWNNFKSEYIHKTEENGKIGQMDKLRATLVIDGVRADYTDLAPKDVLKEYEHFVNTVRTNKDSYTKEDWTVINVNYKALNGRKREVEKDLPKGDGGKITKLQLEYTGIKAVNRPFADNP